jgi:hypothetical protein
MHQTDTIIWIPISEKLPPAGTVLASTKNGAVVVVQLRKGQVIQAHGDKWLDWRGADAGIQFEEVIAWSKCLDLFTPEQIDARYGIPAIVTQRGLHRAVTASRPFAV